MYPNFIGLGGHKCATSSLSYYLDQHPEIYIPPIKGIDFFNRESNQSVGNNQSNIPKTISEYIRLYENINQQKIAGEISSVYLYHQKACMRIKTYVPQAQLIVILRNPVYRSLSAFKMYNSQSNNRNYGQIFENHNLLSKGLYSRYLEMYFEHFEKSQIRIFLFEELTQNPNYFFPELFSFLGVNPNFRPDSSVVLRQGKEIQSSLVNSLLFQEKSPIKSTIGSLLKPFTTPEQRRALFYKFKSSFPTKDYQKTEVPHEVKQKLHHFYQEDILKLQKLIDRDLSHWLNVH